MGRSKKINGRWFWYGAGIIACFIVCGMVVALISVYQYLGAKPGQKDAVYIQKTITQKPEIATTSLVIYLVAPNSEKLVAQKRIVNTADYNPQNALELLLAGPTAQELKDGYSSALPLGSELISYKTQGIEGIADFSARVQAGGGSTSMKLRKDQITQTLLQFPFIKTVTIMVKGEKREEWIFQP